MPKQQESKDNGEPGKIGLMSEGAPLGPPGAGLSDRNGPSDPESKKR